MDVGRFHEICRMAEQEIRNVEEVNPNWSEEQNELKKEPAVRIKRELARFQRIGTEIFGKEQKQVNDRYAQFEEVAKLQGLSVDELLEKLGASTPKKSKESEAA